MNATDWIWIDGEYVPWKEANIHVLTHSLHYGSGAFEGIRAYETTDGPAIFRLKEHVERLLYSASHIGMDVPYSLSEISDAIIETVKRNKVQSCYIRPLIFYGYGKMGINPQGAPVQLAIACWPWGAYLPHEAVDLKTSSFIRIHPQSTVADAKVCGHYVNSMMAVLELRGTKYHEALLLDYRGKIAEGPGENIFLRYGQTLRTPKPHSILPGITRRTVIELAEERGYTIEEVDIEPAEALEASEAFYVGTAAEVTPIRSIDDQVFGDGKPGECSLQLKQAYLDVVGGRNDAYQGYLTVAV